MTGALHVVGLGPGDPELVTIKAARILATAPVAAFFAKRGRPGHARRIADGLLAPGVAELRFEYPYTTEIPATDPRYTQAMTGFYDACASRLAEHLAAGQDVALLCEGDPFFYGSAMVLFDRLAPRFATHVIPGVTGMSGCWSQAHLPMTHGDDVLSVLPGTLDAPALTVRLAQSDAAVIMKVGSNLEKIRAALAATGRLHRAVLVEYGTMANSRICPMDQAASAAPYFALVLVPGRQNAR